MKFHTTLYLLIAFTSVCPEQCYDHELGWKGSNVKALNDCDILREKSSLLLDTLVANTQCVTSVVIIFEDSNKSKTKAGPYLHPGEVILLERVPYKCLNYDVRIKVHCGNCIGQRLYDTRFKLDPMKCYDMRKELNFTINEKSKTVSINNQYFHLSNEYVTECLRSVSLINSNGTEIDNVWRKEYKVGVDRCRNETFTLIYTFASADNVEVKKLEKVVKVPWDPNCDENQMKLASAIAIGLAFAMILVTITIVCYRRRKKIVRAEIVKTENNDTYGTYTRGWDGEGDYGDGDQIEMTDHNPVYGT